MSPRKKIYYISISLVLVLVLVIFYFVNLISTPASDENLEKEIIIKKGEGLSTIAEVLEAKHLINNVTAFKIYAFIEGVASKLQAGTYKLSTSMTVKDIVQVLSQGKLLSNERTIKILEGWNNQEIADYLAENEIVAKDDFLTAAGVTNSQEILPDESYDFLSDKDESVDLEGYLYPDTYRIYKDSEAKDIIKKCWIILVIN